MAKYVEKPTEYDAIQISTELLMPDWFKEAVNKGQICFRFNIENELVVDVYANTTEPITAEFGDYILINPENGALEVYTKEFFESHYEKVDTD